MKTGMYIFCLLLLPVLSMPGCQLVDPSDPPSSSESSAQTEIPDEGLLINFQDHPPESGEEPELRLFMETMETMPCINFSITHEVTDRGATRKIRLLGINTGGVCLTALGPATASISFANLREFNQLHILDGILTERYDITITERVVDLIPQHTMFSESNYTRYYRRPENSFYFRCGTLEEMTYLCDEFHHQLVTEPAITEFTFPDDGYIPYPDSSSGNQVNHPTRFYKYESEDAFFHAGDLLFTFVREEIGETEGNSLSISNWKDESYRSWAMH